MPVERIMTDSESYEEALRDARAAKARRSLRGPPDWVMELERTFAQAQDEAQDEALAQQETQALVVYVQLVPDIDIFSEELPQNVTLPTFSVSPCFCSSTFKGVGKDTLNI
jgi:hypothetical protein